MDEKCKRIKKNKTGRVLTTCLNYKFYLLTGVVICAILLGLVFLGSPSSLYAFFSDKTEGSSTITAGRLGVQVTEVRARTLNYGSGEANIYGTKDIIVAGNGENVVIDKSFDTILADGYMLPISFDVTNTGEFTENIMPQISIGWTDGDSGLEGEFYVYPIKNKGTSHVYTDKDIILDAEYNGGSFALAKIDQAQRGTVVTLNDLQENVETQGKRTVSYKVYFVRKSVVRKKSGVTGGGDYWFNYLKKLAIKPSAKAVFSDNTAPQWSAVDSVSFEVKTKVYSKPFISGIYNSNAGKFIYQLEADNKDKENNKVTGSIDTVSYSGNSKALPYGYGGVPPLYYSVQRYSNASFTGTNETLNPISGTGSSIRFSDVGMDWNEYCYYRVTIYDDYGYEIDNDGDSSNNYPDAAEGGFVYIPDTTLRRWLKSYANNIDKGNTTAVLDGNISSPVTVGRLNNGGDSFNFKFGNVYNSESNKYGNPYFNENIDISKITDLNGLQYATNVYGIYLDDNDIEGTNIQHLPKISLKDLSLNNNKNIEYMALANALKNYNNGGLLNLYLSDMNLLSIDFLDSLGNVNLNTLALNGTAIGNNTGNVVSLEIFLNHSPKITQLYLNDTELTNLDFLDKISSANLSVLGISNNSLSNLKKVEDYYATSLTVLDVSYNNKELNVENMFGAFSNPQFTALKVLNLSNTSLDNVSRIYIVDTSKFYENCVVYSNYATGGKIVGTAPRTNPVTQSLLEVMLETEVENKGVVAPEPTPIEVPEEATAPTPEAMPTETPEETSQDNSSEEDISKNNIVNEGLPADNQSFQE